MKSFLMMVFLFLLFIVFISGCGEKKKKKAGDFCSEHTDCVSGLCYDGKCLDPDQDYDLDGLLNGVEKLLGTDPTKKDSDGDGKNDGDEVGKDTKNPIDTDKDGIIDALDSYVDDFDKDCLPNELDPDNEKVSEDIEKLKELWCKNKGVCKDDFKNVGFSCEKGEPLCDYKKVKDFEEQETKCDGKDNDCDGEIDKNLESFQEGECLKDGVCGAEGVKIKRSCDKGKWICHYEDVPNFEENEVSCDALDNDCDGKVDEDIESFQEGECLKEGVCGAEDVKIKRICDKGVWLCIYDDVKGYEKEEQSCDNLDNDCDGKVDEDIKRIDKKECLTKGVCGVEGTEFTQVCTEGKWVCDWTTLKGYEKEETLCDKLDNDCDGKTDEDLKPLECEKKNEFGVCKGMSKCIDGVPICDAQEPKKEKCDKIDNNCDGNIDEDDVCVVEVGVKGKVYDAKSKEGIEGAEVKVYKKEDCPKEAPPPIPAEPQIQPPPEPVNTAASDEDGNYSVKLDPGEYCMIISAEGYEDTTTWIFTLKEGETLPIDIALKEKGSLTPYLNVCGRVSEKIPAADAAANGGELPIPDVSVSLSGDKEMNILASSNTNSFGFYCIIGVKGVNFYNEPFMKLFITGKKPKYITKIISDIPVVPDVIIFVDFYMEGYPENIKECLSNDFETDPQWKVSEPSLGVQWHRRENKLLKNTAIGKCVVLPEDENCVKNPEDPSDTCAICLKLEDNACIPEAGAIANSYSGKYSYWFGSEEEGNFIGTGGNCSENNGGTSKNSISGSLFLPPIDLSQSTIAEISFYSWWEIESVDPQSPQSGGFDQMRIEVSIDGGITYNLLGYLNPELDQNGEHEQPYTSSGFLKAPKWIYYTFDLSKWVGKVVHIAFTFNSKDLNYNGFRGWLIDDVKLISDSCVEIPVM